MTQTFSFDLISDLHIGDFEEFNWDGQPTSLYCVVAGDIARDRQQLYDCLQHLGQKYKQVFYIDGNNEHRYFFDDLTASYEDLDYSIAQIPNVTYLYQRVVMLNGLAIVGVNGWWTFDLDLNLDQEQAWLFFLDRYKIHEEQASLLLECAYRDGVYLQNTISKLQQHKDVKKILVVSHTVPGLDFIKHDSELSDTYKINLMGNSQLLNCLEQDTDKKITNWVFGHYHGRVDQAVHDIRFCNNPKGRAEDILNSPYFPLRIDIEF